MNPRALYESFRQNKDTFRLYINSIKRNSPWDIYTIINATLIGNPYVSKFPQKFFQNADSKREESFFFLFVKNTFLFYLRQLASFLSYFVAYILYKIYYKKRSTIPDDTIGVDIFFLVDNIIREKQFNENYFRGLYDVLKKYHQNYVFIPRLYGIGKNPFKLRKLLQILNNDDRHFLFEFELLSLADFARILGMIIVYPFQTLRLKQDQKSEKDTLFNHELMRDISSVSFDAFSRYIFGKNIATLNQIDTIYSWSEFQVIDRSFNFGIRNYNDRITLNACQFYINYETYLNTYVEDIDFEMLTSPHKVLVNGSHYLLDRNRVEYTTGVALRYQDLFDFKGIQDEKNILLLGSYIVSDTKRMIESVKKFDHVVFKNHPAVDVSIFGELPENITISNENIYTLFEHAGLVIATASGTCVEAVACGLSVVVMASEEYLTANPLVEYGKGQVWDIAFSGDDVDLLYNRLISYRKNNKNEIENIRQWYKENFFIEPAEENVIKAFEIEKGL